MTFRDVFREKNVIYVVVAVVFLRSCVVGYPIAVNNKLCVTSVSYVIYNYFPMCNMNWLTGSWAEIVVKQGRPSR